MSQLIQSFINQKHNSGYPYNSSAQILSCFDKMLVDNFPEATTITPEIINELMEKIDVYQSEKVNSKPTQQIDIYYNGIGIINIPMNEYELENAFQESIKKIKIA